ncbi:glycosyltransferase family 2 protein [Photobacterium kagoshimensis]|uniref:glycosyltransferase family 2 protein n=1 Tax=Photobacterium kagoshimensis TaxID=2910242 RepID=UPI003D0FDBF1
MRFNIVCKNKTFVSIITATYNSRSYISETYQSILNQSLVEWEWIVTDDCSTDGTFEYLKDLACIDDRLVINRLDVNSGAAVARNNSIALASGTFIAFVDSDDVWEENKLKLQTDFMGDDIDFSFTAFKIFEQDGSRKNRTVDATHNIECFNYKDILAKKATLGCSTVMIRNNGIFDLTMPNLRTGQDYALWLKILRNGAKAHIFKKVLTSYRITPGSISRNKIKKAIRQWSIYRKEEKLNIFQSSYYFVHYALRAIFRKR